MPKYRHSVLKLQVNTDKCHHLLMDDDSGYMPYFKTENIGKDNTGVNHVAVYAQCKLCDKWLHIGNMHT